MKPTDANLATYVHEVNDTNERLKGELQFAVGEYHREKEARRDSQREADALRAEVSKLRAALTEIAQRGPVEGYSSRDAILLRLVATQSIARDALK